MPVEAVVGGRAESDATERRAEVELLGVRLHAITERECVRHVMTELAHGRGGWIVTPNLDHLRRLSSDASFRELCERATLRVADGMPILWAARLQRTPLPGRVAGSDLIHSVSRAAAVENRRVYFLGGDPGTAEEASRVLAARHAGLVIAGVHCPDVGFERDPERVQAIGREIERARPDVVFVALGSPKQERVIDALRASAPAAWWLGIGISFSFVCGRVKRAPEWMQRAGLEWVHRLAQEPRRLARRYLIDGLPFATSLLARAAWRGAFGRRDRAAGRMHDVRSHAPAPSTRDRARETTARELGAEARRRSA